MNKKAMVSVIALLGLVALICILSVNSNKSTPTNQVITEQSEVNDDATHKHSSDVESNHTDEDNVKSNYTDEDNVKENSIETHPEYDRYVTVNKQDLDYPTYLESYDKFQKHEYIVLHYIFNNITDYIPTANVNKCYIRGVNPRDLDDGLYYFFNSHVNNVDELINSPNNIYMESERVSDTDYVVKLYSGTMRKYYKVAFSTQKEDADYTLDINEVKYNDVASELKKITDKDNIYIDDYKFIEKIIEVRIGFAWYTKKGSTLYLLDENGNTTSKITEHDIANELYYIEG